MLLPENRFDFCRKNQETYTYPCTINTSIHIKSININNLLADAADLKSGAFG